MASAPNPALPLFYKDLIPLSSQQHATYKTRATDKATWLAGVNSVPLTVEEFPQAQRNFPIIFTSGNDPVPLALMGMNEGVNVYVDDDGTVNTPIYMPAYARRYPFMLAKLRPDSEELSLCFDPTSDLIGEIEDGQPLFEGNDPSEATKGMLKFCENFEIAGNKTASFIAELKKHDLCEECRFGGILRLQGFDEAGCNWSDPMLSCSGQPTAICVPAARQVIAEARKRINLG